MEFSGFYGNGTACTVLYFDCWYCVEGSQNVNFTYDEIADGVDVETLIDLDCFTSSEPIYTIEELEIAVNS